MIMDCSTKQISYVQRCRTIHTNRGIPGQGMILDVDYKLDDGVLLKEIVMFGFCDVAVSML